MQGLALYGDVTIPTAHGKRVCAAARGAGDLVPFGAVDPVKFCGAGLHFQFIRHGQLIPAFTLEPRPAEEVFGAAEAVVFRRVSAGVGVRACRPLSREVFFVGQGVSARVVEKVVEPVYDGILAAARQRKRKAKSQCGGGQRISSFHKAPPQSRVTIDMPMIATAPTA